MKTVVYFVTLVLGCYGQGFSGYNYPKPSCQLQLPVTYTETQVQTQTQYFTNSVTVPVYITSTVVTERLVTNYATVVSSVPQYFTETSTVYITPSPVVMYQTVVSTASVCADVAVDNQSSKQEEANTYLPPVEQGASSVVDDFKQTVSNPYLPPTGSGTSGNVVKLSLGDAGVASYQRSIFQANPFDSRRSRFVLPLGALPPNV
ncbi:uncharacterized protein LOC129725372 [Wyeomyia smithii]|uniref:uncharacterized protein LOC129725372 n=1 Tax=Wyeomyia smithii TaxID=174621 RepID=UPI002467E603|nr:uncharacterized protein LOC129725372 [Wyeomyia smithii]